MRFVQPWARAGGDSKRRGGSRRRGAWCGVWAEVSEETEESPLHSLQGDMGVHGGGMAAGLMPAEPGHQAGLSSPTAQLHPTCRTL